MRPHRVEWLQKSSRLLPPLDVSRVFQEAVDGLESVQRVPNASALHAAQVCHVCPSSAS